MEEESKQKLKEMEEKVLNEVKIVFEHMMSQRLLILNVINDMNTTMNQAEIFDNVQKKIESKSKEISFGSDVHSVMGRVAAESNDNDYMEGEI